MRIVNTHKLDIENTNSAPERDKMLDVPDPDQTLSVHQDSGPTGR
jgi:hypothetical protein